MSDSEYQKRQDGDKMVFEVTPSTAPKNTGAFALGVLPILLLGLFAWGMHSTSLTIVVAVLVSLFVYFGFFHDGRPRAHKSHSPFRVSSTAIETNGRSFNKDDIHRLIIANGMTKQQLALDHVAGAGNPAMMDSVAVRRGYAQRLSTVANSLDLETGGKAYMLAGGMNETTAYGLMTDVGRVIGLRA